MDEIEMISHGKPLVNESFWRWRDRVHSPFESRLAKLPSLADNEWPITSAQVSVSTHSLSRVKQVARGAGTRERILAAAREVMLSKGLVRATTKEIARAADLSEGTLYNHFANKEELF